MKSPFAFEFAALNFYFFSPYTTSPSLNCPPPNPFKVIYLDTLKSEIDSESANIFIYGYLICITVIVNYPVSDFFVLFCFLLKQKPELLGDWIRGTGGRSAQKVASEPCPWGSVPRIAWLTSGSVTGWRRSFSAWLEALPLDLEHDLAFQFSTRKKFC